MLIKRLILPATAVFCWISCNTTDPQPPPPPPPPKYEPTIELAVLDSGLTDAVLRLRFLDTVAARSFQLERNGTVIATVAQAQRETVFMDSLLAPNTLYAYKAWRLRDSLVIDTSRTVQVKTIDTTSHDFIFETFIHGDGASSVLWDVAIINDTSIYAVGEINFRDSAGNWQNPPYNLAKWNGNSWQYFTTSDSGFWYGENYSVHSFSVDDIWVGSDAPEHWDGQRWTFYGPSRGYIGGFRILGLWGKDSHSMYAVGEYGNIRRFNGTSWSTVESGTTLHIYDIFGDVNTITGETEIYAVAGNQFITNEHRILRIDGNQVTALPDAGIPSSLDGIWFDAGRRYYATGDGTYIKRDPASPQAWQPLAGLTLYYLYGIRGAGLNDIVACGSFGELLHFNGSTWKSFRTVPGITGVEFRSSVIKGDCIAAVGFVAPRGFIAIGRRPRSL
jgi:hypothetical protein